MASVFLVRHGETEFNAEGRYQGQMDSPLTLRGRRQATAVAKTLAARFGSAPVRLVSSPLGRTLATAEIIARRLETCVAVDTDDRVMEVGMGAWDGLTRAEIRERWPDARRGKSVREWMFHGPGGESLKDLMARAGAALEDARLQYGAFQVLVSHAVTGRIVRAIHLGMPVLEALKLDAPQDAAFELLPDKREKLLRDG